MNISLNPIGRNYQIGFRATDKKPVSQPTSLNDVFVKTSNADNYKVKLEKLFPNGELNSLYDEMNKSLRIDKPAKLQFFGENDGVFGGGFTFEKNEINLSLADLVGNDTKLVGIKDGKKVVLVSTSVQLPLFVTKQLAEEFIQMQSKSGNLGFDKLVAEPVTDKEMKKFVYQKILHEVIHSQQHMILRQTEGFGTKKVIEAWTHIIPKSSKERNQLNEAINKRFNDSYWSKQPVDKVKFPKNSPIAILAGSWLEAIRHYPPVESPEYNKNAIEQDAYSRSAMMANKIYGSWNNLAGY